MRSGALRFEAHTLVRTIAERLRPGPAAAAEMNPLAIRHRVLDALVVDYRCRPINPVRAASSNNDSDFFCHRRLHYAADGLVTRFVDSLAPRES